MDSPFAVFEHRLNAASKTAVSAGAFRPDTHLACMIDIALAAEFVIPAGGAVTRAVRIIRCTSAGAVVP
jgi:hypothetical protein